MFKRETTPQIHMVYEYSQNNNYYGRDNPNSDFGDSSEPGSDNDGRSNNNSGIKWTIMVKNLNQEDRIVSGNK